MMNYKELLKVDAEKRNLPYSEIVELEKKLPTRTYTLREVIQMFPHLNNFIMEISVGGYQNENADRYYDLYGKEILADPQLADRKVIGIYITDYSETNKTATNISVESDDEETNQFYIDEVPKKSLLEKFLKLMSFFS